MLTCLWMCWGQSRVLKPRFMWIKQLSLSSSSTVLFPLPSRQRVEEEIIKLEKAGIIEPVAHLEWAVTVVPLVKQNGSIRLCGDVKLTVNKVASQEKYPLPCIEDMFSSLTSWTLQIRICSWNWRKKAGNMSP